MSWSKGVVRFVAVGAGLLLSLFLAIGCAAAEPAPTAVRAVGVGAAHERAEQRQCLIHRHEGNGLRLVVPGALGVPSPAPRTGVAAAAPGLTADGRTSVGVAAPRTARQAVPLTRSGELPVFLQVFRC
ncbi:hypothetical protein ACFYXS_34175 [Streptomyces sp. NPDC002574]|uniref:hypothetical protein n=1 Tax=Streptomyces sp. NPDC002574 TaxID=3364652 RepID=UPI0036CE4546